MNLFSPNFQVKHSMNFFLQGYYRTSFYLNQNRALLYLKCYPHSFLLSRTRTTQIFQMGMLLNMITRISNFLLSEKASESVELMMNKYSHYFLCGSLSSSPILKPFIDFESFNMYQPLEGFKLSFSLKNELIWLKSILQLLQQLLSYMCSNIQIFSHMTVKV